jgi:hypothetical protein
VIKGNKKLRFIHEQIIKKKKGENKERKKKEKKTESKN